MIIEQIYTGCLSQGAYYIESNGEAAIIDPLREVKPYLERAHKNGATINYIFETHFHADFVSGHVTLSKETDAPIVYGPNANPTFDAIIAADGQEFRLGELTIIALHTPGHTMESTTFLLKDKNGRDHAIFTGDTLFLGDVGRPDLAQKADTITQEELAGLLFKSLREKIMPLANDVVVYPAHGAGSACGKNMMKETVDTLGNQKEMNYALRENMTEEEFIKEVTDGLLAPPQYFPLNVKMNREGYADLDEVLKRGTRTLSPGAFERAANETGAVILDVRHQDEYEKGHIPNAIFIGIDGSFAPWAGALIADVQQPILLVTPPGREEETVTRLARVGFDHTLGYLEGGFERWAEASKPVDKIDSISAENLNKWYEKGEKTVDFEVFDVRKETEYDTEHVLDAKNTPLDFINEHLSLFPQKSIFYMHCASGYRSMVAASILKKRGYHNLVNIEGGLQAIKKTSISTTATVQQS
ncbi:MBL fold metallo-hydrolase [Flavimarina sp. Hel_I_48]|uniref:MBL fold metallo-hydrolase n=1 Tax=Flavimarina sp. Hel_I_48 TaxID=1392488 RepID=UPI0004DEDA5C|nr:MBL fold metallo-hydrolase [Flavimarina sp. Hel_I_48]